MLDFGNFYNSISSLLKPSLESSIINSPQKRELRVLKNYSLKNKAICLVRYFPANSFSTHHRSSVLIYEKNNQLFVLLEKMNKAFYSSNFNKPLNKIVLEDYIYQELAEKCKKIIFNFKLSKNLKEKVKTTKVIKI